MGQRVNGRRRRLEKDLGKRQTRMGVLASLREQVVVLRTMDYSWEGIAAILRIAVEDARDLGKLYRRKTYTYRLTWRSINVLLNGKHAAIGGRTMAQRVRKIAEIAEAYSADELLAEPGIGPSTATDIQLWLEARGSHFRVSDGSDRKESKEPRQDIGGAASDSALRTKPPGFDFIP